MVCKFGLLFIYLVFPQFSFLSFPIHFFLIRLFHENRLIKMTEVRESTGADPKKLVHPQQSFTALSATS